MCVGIGYVIFVLMVNFLQALQHYLLGGFHVRHIYNDKLFLAK